ncbi:ParB/RepB/Spo0J family partition protein [Terrabacter terrigena]|uniref:ParB/RepB/Spo0J family partition protein n=1 Tax=Terrabacter terrigena TaxID=574718 RepID=A0ABW3MWH3_9MICO
MTTTKTSAPELLTLTFAKIAPHPHNPRRSVGDVADLAASIKTKGILEPVVVAPWPTDTDQKAPRSATHILIAGHRRLAGAKEAGLKSVPAFVRNDLDNIASQIEAMVVENLQRSDLTPVEEAHAYQELLDLKVPVKQIATTTGQTQARVRDRLKLTRIPETVQDLTHAGQITLTDALAFDEFKDDEEALAKLTEAVGTDDWAHTVNRVRRVKEDERRFADRVRTLEGKGVRFLTQDDLDALPRIETSAGTLSPSYKSLSVYMPGVDYVHEWSQDADVHAAKHAACPGHAAQAVPESRIVRYYCLTPDAHTPAAATSAATDTVGEAPAISPREAQRQREFEEQQKAREARRVDLDAAQRTRLDHLAAIVTAGPSDELATDCLRSALAQPGEDGYWGNGASEVITLVGSLVGIDVADVVTYGDGRTERVEAFWTQALADLSIGQLAVVLDVAFHAYEEDELANDRWDEPHPRAWFQRLVDVYGYTPSTFERDCFAAAAPADEDGDDQ